MTQIVRLDFGDNNLHVRVLGKWCLIAYLNVGYLEWEYIVFDKLTAKLKETLSKKYNLDIKDFTKIQNELKRKTKEIKYEPTSDIKDKILYAVNDISPEKLTKREVYETSVVDCYIAEYTKNPKVIKTLIDKGEENLLKIIKKRSDYPTIIGKKTTKKRTPKTTKTKEKPKKEIEKPKPKRTRKKKSVSIDDIL